MFARVSTYEGTADDFDRGVEPMRSDIVPKVRAMPGSAGVLAMVDRSTGRSLTITLWDSEDALATSREVANRLRAEAAALAGSTITDVTEFEVAVAELA